MNTHVALASPARKCSDLSKTQTIDYQEVI